MMKILDEGYVYDAETIGGAKQACFCTSFKLLSSGKMLASFRLGSTKDSADGNCLLAESCDGVKSWQVICAGFNAEVDGVVGEIRAVELAELANGALAAFVLWVDRLGGKKLYDGATDSVLPTKLLMTVSTDGGRTWDHYRRLDTQHLLGPSYSGPTVQLPKQGWLIPFENFQPGQGVHSANAFFSPDGVCFDQLLTVAHDESNERYFFDERLAHDPQTGRVVAMFWTYNRRTEQDECIHIAWGNPQSLSWEAPFSTGIAGQVCQPLPLPDGRLAAFYVHRHPPGSLRLIISPDGGRNWDHKSELVVYAAGAARQRGLDGESNYAQYWDDMLTTWTFGHPTGAVLPDGTLLLGYYAGPTASCLNVRWARVEL